MVVTCRQDCVATDEPLSDGGRREIEECLAVFHSDLKADMLRWYTTDTKLSSRRDHRLCGPHAPPQTPGYEIDASAELCSDESAC